MINGIALIWCNFCNARPADGKLEAILVEGGTAEMFDACKFCVTEFIKEKNEQGVRP